MLRTMPTLRALLTGLAAGLLVFAAGAAGAVLRLSDAVTLALLCIPLALLAGASLFGVSTERMLSRLASGAIGKILAGAAAVSAVLYLRRHTDWFNYDGDQGFELFLLLLACLAMIPAGVAAAAARPRHGFGLALGFSLGMTIWMAWLPPINPGYVLLMAIGVFIGTLVSTIRSAL